MNARRNPNGHPRPKLAALASLFGMLLLTPSSVAYAQPIETITVTAPRVVQQTIVTGHSPSTGAPIEETTISRTVSYADLDLSKSTDAARLKTRVENTAKDLCIELDKLYPLQPKDPTCARKSSDRAMVQVHALIAEASGK